MIFIFRFKSLIGSSLHVSCNIDSCEDVVLVDKELVHLREDQLDKLDSINRIVITFDNDVLSKQSVDTKMLI